MGQTVLVLGGGVGGLVVARSLRKALPKEHRVVLVEREDKFVFAPSLLWLMTGGRTAGQISRPLDRLEKKGIERVQGEIERIDPATREVVVSGRTLTGDHLVVCLGAELAPETVPGLAQAGHSFYTLEGATSLENALARFEGGTVVVLTAAPLYKCPAAPYEAAMLLAAALKKRGLAERSKVEFYAAEPGPMGVAGQEVSQAVRALVESKGVACHCGHQVREVDPTSRRLRFENGAEAKFDLLAFVPPHRAPRVIRESPLAGPNGWIEVDRATLRTRFDHVYALGDVVTIPLSIGKPLPKAGVFAHGEAEVVAKNLARVIAGEAASAAFDGAGECFIETGEGKAGFGKGNFYAEPAPDVRLHPPGRSWHAAKVLFEKDFLRRWA